jgi:hypothetical protein
MHRCANRGDFARVGSDGGLDVVGIDVHADCTIRRLPGDVLPTVRCNGAVARRTCVSRGRPGARLP